MSKKRYLNAIITESSKGTGLAIAKIFAEAGHNVLLNGPEEDTKDIAVGIGKKYRVKTAASNADLINPDQIREMVYQANKSFGQVDVLINNGNIQYVAPVDEFPGDKWDKILAVNLNAVFHSTKAVWKGMKQNLFGRIINITSTHALVASEYKAAHVAANHGIAGLTKVLALEGANYGITCNSICHGYLKTSEVEDEIADHVMAHNISEEQVIQKIMLKKQPIKSFVEAGNIGMMALFLASEYGSAITGTTLPVDGGWTAR